MVPNGATHHISRFLHLNQSINWEVQTYKRLNSFLNLVYTLLTKNRSSSHFCRRVYFSKVKDTHRENSPSNKTKALTTSMGMCIWEIGLLNQLFISSSYTETKFKKKKSI